MSRTKLQKKEAKKLLKLPPGDFQEIDLSKARYVPGMTRAFSNNRYVVMIFDDARLLVAGVTVHAIQAMIQRHDDKPIVNHWAELQGIKNTLFGHESTAIEFYPPQSELIDCANIYWLWVVSGELISSLVDGVTV